MKPPFVRRAEREAADLLRAIVGAGRADIEPASGADVVFRTRDGQTLVAELKGRGDGGTVRSAIAQVRQYASRYRGAVPVVVVPYMGELGRRLCEEAGVSWLDLSGNVRLTAPGLRIHIEGRPNRYKPRGRPSSVFAPKSARIARWLLLHPAEPFTQRALARATGMDEGSTSRVVRRLESEGLINRDPAGIRAKDPGLLLDAWREQYDFDKHTIFRGHIAERSSETLAHKIGAELERHHVIHAATGLAGAWLLTRFAGFRIATFYVSEPPDHRLLGDLGFEEDARGANVWLVLPKDEGVFQGSTVVEGVSCAHPVQVYLDLKGHPERATEAAEHLRHKLLSFGTHADQADDSRRL